jgi:hypothetical protein
MFAQIKCRRRDTNLPPTDHTYHFRKWLGRNLSKREHFVINALERRRRKGTIKVHIIDKPGQNSRNIIIAYIRYLGTLYPLRVAVVYDETKKQAREVCRSLPIEAYPASVKRPNTCRGMNYDIALILNPPAHYLPDIFATVWPVVGDYYLGCALIVLTTPPPHPKLKGRNRYVYPEMAPFYYEQLIDRRYRPGPPLDYTAIVELTDDLAQTLKNGGLSNIALRGEDTETALL